MWRDKGDKGCDTIPRRKQLSRSHGLPNGKGASDKSVSGLSAPQANHLVQPADSFPFQRLLEAVNNPAWRGEANMMVVRPRD